MSDDPDFPKANHVLQVLRQARLSRNKDAAIMLGELIYEMAGTGLRTPEIEESRQVAWVAISALAKTLKEERIRRACPLEGRVWSDGKLDRTTRLAVFAAPGLFKN